MANYPVAYKKGSERYAAPKSSSALSGFQRSAQDLAKAANDNLPIPANDNALDVFNAEQRAAIAARYAEAEILSDMASARIVRAGIADLLGPPGLALTVYDLGYLAGEQFGRWLEFRRIQRIPVPRPGAPDPVGAGWQYLGGPVPSPLIPVAATFDEWWTAPVLATDQPDIGTLHSVSGGHATNWATDTATWPVYHEYSSFFGYDLWSMGYGLDRPSSDLAYDPNFDWRVTFRTRRVWRDAPGDPVVRERIRRELTTRGEPTWTEDVLPDHVRRNDTAVSTRGMPPTVHVSRPTGPREREKKVTANSSRAYRIVSGVLALTTESLDLVKALWEALPDARKTGYYKLHKRDPKSGKIVEFYVKRFHPKPQQMTNDLWQHFDEIDVVEAVDNLAKNHIEDFVIGKSSSITSDAVSNSGVLGHRPFGLEVGPAL